MRKIAVVGAGLAGVVCARTLSDAGFEVTVFEKSGGTGGRLATRRTEHGAFDHGAQYLTAREPPFRAMLTGLSRAGSVAYWEPDGKDNDHPWHTGVPGMSKLVKPLLHEIDVRLKMRIEMIAREDDAVVLTADDGVVYRFDRVIVTAPAPQTHALLAGVDPVFDALAKVDYSPCWAGMFAFDKRIEKLPDMLRGDDNTPLGFVAREASRPGREGENFIVHGGGSWSREHLEIAKEDAAVLLLAALSDHAGETLKPVHADAHRWRYARVDKALGKRFLASDDNRLYACGDGLLGGRAEAAFESARQLCDYVKTSVSVMQQRA